MRDRTKVIIGFGSIWGLFALGALLIGSFTIGANDTAPGIAALVLYGLTILPSCILAIWYRKSSAVWLIVLSAIALFGFVYQVVIQRRAGEPFDVLLSHLLSSVIIAAVPGFLGTLLLRDASLSPQRSKGRKDN